MDRDVVLVTIDALRADHVGFAERLRTTADVPVGDDMPESMSLRARRNSSEAVWEETDEGWRAYVVLDV